MKNFQQYITEEPKAKRLCTGPNCGVKTAYKVTTHPDTGQPVWSCENCGHMTPKTTRITAKKRAMDDLFNDLSNSKT